MAKILPLDPATYRRHPIHGGPRDDGTPTPERLWAETNCYTDVVIELLHGMGHEPIAALPFTLTIDFDVDQWTFFKFPHADVEALYGLAIHELAPWRGLATHVEEQVAAGRPVLVELDSYFLPDTGDSAFHRAHVKSTVAVDSIDLDAGVMEYFHNQGYHRVAGQDFRDLYQLDGLAHERMLPPYIEFVKALPRARPLRGAALLDGSLDRLRHQLARVPARSPFDAFATRFQDDLEWLPAAGLDGLHAYSFATLRQYGACHELAHTYLAWLAEQGVDVPASARTAFFQISESTKQLQFQLARAMVRKRALDLSPLAEMGAAWERAMTDLTARFG